MYKTVFILSVSGGMVQDVFCSDPESRVVLVDWDAEESDLDAPNVVEVRAGKKHLGRAFVSELETNSLSELSGTDVLHALRAANAVPPEFDSVKDPENS